MICIYHSRDLDGWCSAAIVVKWFRTLSFRNDNLTMIGWDYGQHIPNIPKNEEVILVDISLPVETMALLTKENNLVWIDHHISAIKEMTDNNIDPHGQRDPKFSACELSWMYLFGTKLPEFVRLLGRYDCFGHKGTEEEQQVLEFQYAARAYYKSYEDCYQALENADIDKLLETGKSIYKYLCTEAVQDYSKTFPIEIFNKEQVSGEPDKYRFLAINRQRFNCINFGIDYHKDGYDGFACFHYADNKWNWSLYNDNGKVDCSKLAKQRGGGGHKGAAGFIEDVLFSKL